MILVITGAVIIVCSVLPYIIYGLGISFGKKMERIPRMSGYPPVSIIISAYNEEAVIRKRIENIAASEYPAGSYEVIFVDDCSSDNTLSMAREAFRDAGIAHIIIHNDRRLGTNVSYNQAIPGARYPVIVTTDADVFFRPDSLVLLITRLMSDQAIAAACGELQPVTGSMASTTRLEFAYRSYYGKMCSWESAVDSTYNFNGALVAFKKDLVNRINDKRGSDDANTAFEAIRRGYRAVYEPDAVVFEEIPQDLMKQYRQKIRRATRLIEATLSNLDLLFKKRPFCRVFYPLRLFMMVLSPLLFFAGMIVFMAGLLLISPILLLAFAVLIAVLNVAGRNLFFSFIVNQFYLLIGLLQMGNDMKTWDSTSKKRSDAGN